MALHLTKVALRKGKLETPFGTFLVLVNSLEITTEEAAEPYEIAQIFMIFFVFYPN